MLKLWDASIKMIFSATLDTSNAHSWKIKYSGGRNVMLQDLRNQTLVKNSHRCTVCELSRTSRVSVSPCCALVTVAVSCVIIGRHMGCQSYCMSVTGNKERESSCNIYRRNGKLCLWKRWAILFSWKNFFLETVRPIKQQTSCIMNWKARKWIGVLYLVIWMPFVVDKDVRWSYGIFTFCYVFPFFNFMSKCTKSSPNAILCVVNIVWYN